MIKSHVIDGVALTSKCGRAGRGCKQEAVAAFRRSRTDARGFGPHRGKQTPPLPPLETSLAAWSSDWGLGLGF